MSALLEVEGLTRHFAVTNSAGNSIGTVHAVTDVSFKIGAGETLGLIGESGCGKSTVSKMVVRLVEPTRGAVVLEGEDINKVSFSRMKMLRKRVQMVFQDPFGSLDPRQAAEDIIAEPLLVHGMRSKSERRARVVELMERVGLRADQMRNTPAAFSGGQRQRIAIARALALNPALIVADEPVSALDVSIQAQVVNLMVDIQKELGLSYLFVSHDLGVIRHISDRVAVMYLGRIVEIGRTSDLFANPGHPYTRTLMDALPKPNPARRLSKKRVPRGEIPSPLNPPTGCAFHPRCPLATDVCRQQLPALRPLAGGTQGACHHAA
ncbi:ABC transporter ATP-binding protein [Devosia sediminis]|uniref:Dipeptide ABC transporter ATP-binding protein n=1 Tax=Devosia sediminis TaxID=2798801 RepID=A0A934IXT6_9HYPH|nr:dipeptide ABC transporter ATP-binding protein [Devosia sediminis]MBJ3786367.1 dipeptide ABC transporter ATP-binding protein [Devosia sediminis]